MNEAFLCLGGNLGSRLGFLAAARDQISARCGTIVGQSSLYESAAWGYDSENLYLNQVIKLKTELSAVALLKVLRQIEILAGRKRSGTTYLNRTLDIDILFFNHEVKRNKALELPHPRLHQRLFVLKPMLEIDPGLIHPLLNKSIAQLIKVCDDKSHVYKYEARPYICIEGNIGAGKTTLARALALKLKASFVPEKFEKNHLLPLFYEAPEKYAFPLEFSFLISRFEQLSSALQPNAQTTVSDFSIYKCLWFAQANLKKKELEVFEKHFHAFEKHLKQPDLIVFINTSKNNLLRNIKKRNRGFESGIKSSYLKKLDEHYAHGIKFLRGPCIIELKVKSYEPKLTGNLLVKIEQLMKEKFGWPN